MTRVCARYHKTLEPGMNVLVPVIDKVKYVHSLKEITVDIPLQLAVTSGGSGVKQSTRGTQYFEKLPDIVLLIDAKCS